MSIDLAKTPSFRLDGKRALITGAGRGIGLACAAALAEAGAHVTLAARSANEIAAGVDAIRAAGGKADALRIDVSNVLETTRALDGVECFDILLNSAGTNRPKPFLEA